MASVELRQQLSADDLMSLRRLLGGRARAAAESALVGDVTQAEPGDDPGDPGGGGKIDEAERELTSLCLEQFEKGREANDSKRRVGLAPSGMSTKRAQ